MIKTYAAEVTQTKMKVNLVDPGIVRSKLRALGFPGEDRSALKAPEAVTDAFVALAAIDCPHHGETLRAE